MKKEKYDYQIKIQKFYDDEENYYVSTVPELPGCMSDGETYVEAVQNIQIAIELWLEAAEIKKQEVPKPKLYTISKYSGKLSIRIPKSVHKNITIRADEENISINQLINSYISNGLGNENEIENKYFLEVLKNKYFDKRDIKEEYDNKLETKIKNQWRDKDYNILSYVRS